MQFTLFFFISILLSSLQLSSKKNEPTWGFHAHKIINKMAVFILPPEMMIFFKKNIEFISEHAPDPDKRRYVMANEAVRHYMDIDHWGEYPYIEIPRKWNDAFCKYVKIIIIQNDGDSLVLKDAGSLMIKNDSIRMHNFTVSYTKLKDLVQRKLPEKIIQKTWTLATDTVNQYLDLQLDAVEHPEIVFSETFTNHGINPFHIKKQYDRLKTAFERKDLKSVIRLATDMGHYVADAHVPLHATKNYNGQLTDQIGIHAFWESRLPELFAEKQYLYFVGKARYIKDIETFAWEAILESNKLHFEVLEIEKELSVKVKEDEQYSFESRLGRTVRTQSLSYSSKFHSALQGMVEKRMQDAILALGSIWFTAWVDAGQPVLNDSTTIHWTNDDILHYELLDQKYYSNLPKGRDCN